MSILEVRDLHTSFFTKAGEVKAVNGVSFDVDRGKVLGIVGESGSGKSVTAYSILQILTYPGKIVSGSVKLHGEELVGCSEDTIRKVRGNRISIIFQDPMTSLNPVYTVGNQLMEAIMLHTDRDKDEAFDRAVEMLDLVGINEPHKRVKQYPYELSGGMRQRVMIAMALACEPDILIADEPTTALDVTIQAQILELMQKLQRELGMAIIMITHDLGVIASMCDDVIVMYAGKVCEKGTADDIFYSPKHEYTKGLIKSIPYGSKKKGKLIPIAGSPVDVLNLPSGCAFSPRCNCAMKVCLDTPPIRNNFSPTHYASCWQSTYEAIKKGDVTLEQVQEELNSEECRQADSPFEGGEADE
ncbi:MAG: ABC transporter ATP-binding protein [Clostridia bacterium]|nr:ABC transporter ATP-binding protein [Clostridia bacterium]